MYALVYTDTQKLVYREEKNPKLVNGESIIKVSASGICGSDMHAYHGKDNRRIPPLILGHEISGIIDKGKLTGKKVTVLPETVDENLYLSSRNLKNINVVPVRSASTYDLLDCQLILADLASVEALNNILAG